MSKAAERIFKWRLLQITEFAYLLILVGSLDVAAGFIAAGSSDFFQKVLKVREKILEGRVREVVLWIGLAGAWETLLILFALLASWTITLPALVNSIHAHVAIARFALTIAGGLVLARAASVSIINVVTWCEARFQERRARATPHSGVM